VPGRIARNLFLLLSPLSAVQCLGLAAFVFLTGSDALQNAAANGDTRTLTFRHSHREEDDFTVTFKRDGKYDEDALAKLNHYLRDWRNDKEIKMDLHLFDILWEVNRDVGGKEPIEVVSSYRSPETNSMLRRRGGGVAQFSQHMLGKALDFRIPNVPLEELRYAGLRLQRGGVGFYPSSDFVHLDTGSVRHWPRMAPDLLAKVMSSKPSTQLASAERRRMPAPSASDDDEAETVKPVATRAAARKPETKPAAVATAPNAEQAFALASASSTPIQLSEAPRKPARAAAPAETTANVQSWLNDIDSRPANDRVAPETALAYAAAAAPDAQPQPQRSASLVNPMPLPRTPAPATTQIPRTPGKPAVQAKPGQRYDDPWMRSVTLAESMHYSRVTVYGPFDARGVQSLMQKPASSLLLAFRDDPYEGLTSRRFDGPAVAFLPTMAFRQRQASLR
jgi:uncharacterized protein YcbK (DUF882 family)